MKLGNPSEGILSSAMAEVLSVLGRMTPGRSGRTIARACNGVSAAQVANVLKRLASLGVVSVSEVPPANQYFLNRENLLAQHLLGIVEAKSFLLSWLTSQLKVVRGLRAAIVYGSVARNTDGPDSDLDLLLVFEEEPEQAVQETLSIIREQFRAYSANELSLTVLKMSEVQPSLVASSAFLLNVMDQGHVLIGEPLRTC